MCVSLVPQALPVEVGAVRETRDLQVILTPLLMATPATSAAPVTRVMQEQHQAFLVLTLLGVPQEMGVPQALVEMAGRVAPREMVVLVARLVLPATPEVKGVLLEQAARPVALLVEAPAPLAIVSVLIKLM